jgi:DNA-binding HxlR family transcriptional regulator
MRTYGQYCPIARGAEIFAERWTPLIIRNLHLGCGNFSEILEGAPGLSRTLLSERLKQLEWVGVVESNPKPDGRGRHYEVVRLRAGRRERRMPSRGRRRRYNTRHPSPQR